MNLYETDAVSLKGCGDGTVVRLRNGVVATITEDAMDGYWINFPGLPQGTWVLDNGCCPFGFHSQFDVMEIVKRKTPKKKERIAAVSLKGCGDGTVVRLRNGVVATITKGGEDQYHLDFPNCPAGIWVHENGCYGGNTWFSEKLDVYDLDVYDVVEIVKLGDAPVIRQPSTKVIVLKAGSAAVFTSVEEAVRASDPGTEILEVEVKARYRVSVTKTAVPVK